MSNGNSNANGNGNGVNDFITPPNSSIALKIPSNLNILIKPSSTNALTSMVNNNLNQQQQHQQQRRGSLTSTSSTSNSCGSSNTKKHPPTSFHTNFSKHSNSIDGICLLAEEESAATLTPTTELDINKVTLTNGFDLQSLPPNKSIGHDFLPFDFNSQLHHNHFNKKNHQQQQNNIVPANDHKKSIASTFKYWPTKLLPSTVSTTTAAATSATGSSASTSAPHTKNFSTNFNNKFKRRQNVDPNG